MAVRATEVYVCGWEGSEYNCRLISQEQKPDDSIVEFLPLPDPIRIDFPGIEDLPDYFDQ